MQMRALADAVRAPRIARVGLLLALALLAPPAVAAGQDTGTAPASAPAVRYPYEFGSSSVPMVRNAQLFSAVGAVTDRAIGTVLDQATAHLFEKRGPKAVLARIARLYFLDMPVASLAQVYNHEYGHITRAGLAGGYSVRIDTWPWPFPIAGPRIRGGGRDFSASDPLPYLAAVAGGSEASHVLADTLIDRAYAADRASYFDMVLYIYGKLDPSAYAIAYSGPSRPDTDPWMTAMTLAYARALPLWPWPEDPAVLFGSIRTGAWLNLLDYALVGSIEATIADYVVAGRPVVRPRWLSAGPVRLVPGFNYTPTPRGLQYRINCRIGRRAATGTVYVRWTQSLKGDSVDERIRQMNDMFARHGSLSHIPAPTLVPLRGIGGDWRWASGRAVTPGIAADAWRDIDRHVAGRAELTITYRQPWLGETRAVRFGIGGKSAGYLMGFPEPRGFYVSAALLADF